MGLGLLRRWLFALVFVGVGSCCLMLVDTPTAAQPPKAAPIKRVGYRLAKVLTIDQVNDNEGRGWNSFYEAVREADGSIQVVRRKYPEKQWHIWPRERRAILFRDFGKDAIVGTGSIEVLKWTEPPQEFWTDRDYKFDVAVKATWKDKRTGCIVGGLQYYTEPPDGMVMADGSRTRVSDVPPFKMLLAGDLGRNKIVPEAKASITVRPRFDPANAPLKHGFRLCVHFWADCNPPTFKIFYYYDQLPLDAVPRSDTGGAVAGGTGSAGEGNPAAGGAAGGTPGEDSALGGTGSAGGGNPGSGGVSAGAATDGSSPLAEPSAVSRMALQAANRQVVPGGSVVVPVWLSKAVDVANINFTVSYDPRVVQPEGQPIRGNLLANALFSGNAKETGIVRVGFAQTSGVNDTGTVAYLRFRAAGQPGARTPLRVQATMVNDSRGTTLPVDCIDGSIQIVSPDGMLPGDYDGDGRLTELDALAALQMSVRLIPENLVLDVDKDGQVTSRDAVIILQRAVRGDPKR